MSNGDQVRRCPSFLVFGVSVYDSLSLHLVFRFQFMFREIVSSTITCTNNSFSYPLCKAKDPALLKS